jgi:hypothetical protein
MYNNGRGHPLAPIGGGVGLETLRYNNTLEEMNNQLNQFKLYEQQLFIEYQQQQFENNTDNYTEYPLLGQGQHNNNKDTSDYRDNMPQYMYDNYAQQQQQHPKLLQQQQHNYQQHHQQHVTSTINRPQQQQQQQQQQHQRGDNQQRQRQYPQYGSYPAYRANPSYYSSTPSYPPPSSHPTQIAHSAQSINPSYYSGFPSYPPPPSHPTQIAQSAPSHKQPIQKQNRDPRLRPRLPPPPPAELNNEPPRTMPANPLPPSLLNQRRPPPTTGDPRPTSLSNNRRAPPAFKAPWLLDDLVRHDQVTRHLGNWETFPVSLGRRLDEFLADIKPPLPDEELRAELATVGKECRVAIREVVVQHLLKQSDKITDRLYDCDGLPDHIQEVKKQAFEIIKRRSGRLTRDSIDGLNRLTKMFGNGVSQENSLKPNLVKLVANSDLNCALLSSDAMSDVNRVIRMGNDMIGTVADGIFAHHEEMDVAEAVASSLVETENIIRPNAKKMLVYNVKTSNQFDSLNAVGESPGKRKRLNTPSASACASSSSSSTVSPVAKERRKNVLTSPLQNLPTSPIARRSSMSLKHVHEPSSQPQQSNSETMAPRIVGTHQTSSQPQQSDSEARSPRRVGARYAVNPKITITIKPNDPDSVKQGKVTVHPEGQNFELTLDSTVKSMVIGSSNLRQTLESDLDVNTHVVCIPGANIQYITLVTKQLNELLRRGELTPLSNIVVTTGLNNRDDEELPPIADLLHSLDGLPDGVNGVYMGVSAERHKMTTKQLSNVDFINTEAARRGSQFIPPLETCKFRHSIHYDDETAHNVTERITSYLSDFQSY